MRRWDKKLDKAVRMEREVEPPLKTFKAVNKNLIVLEVLGDDYWAVWKPNDYKLERGSLKRLKCKRLRPFWNMEQTLALKGKEGGHRRDPTMSQCMTLGPVWRTLCRLQ